MKKIVCIIAASLLSAPALAGIVKCVDAGGAVEYKEAPCPGNKTEATPHHIKAITGDYTERKKPVVKDAPQFDGETLSMRFEKISLRSALKLIAEFAALQLEYSGDDQMVAMSYIDTPWDQVVHELSLEHGFKYELKDGALAM